jgi:hypothetical protein
MGSDGNQIPGRETKRERSPPIDWKQGEGARRSSSSPSGLAGEYTGGREEVKQRAHEHETILLPDRGGGQREREREDEAMINGGESQSRWVGGSFVPHRVARLHSPWPPCPCAGVV